MVKTLLRARFEKTGRAVYISHLDLMRTMARAFRRSGIPFWYTEGFTPRVHLDFLLPLPLGVTGTDEFFDFAVLREPSEAAAEAGDYVNALNRVLPEGIKVTDIALPENDRNAIAAAAYEVTLEGVSEAALTEFFSREVISAKKFSKKSGEKIIDIKPYISDLEIISEKSETIGKDSEILVKITLPAGNKLNINTSVLTDAMKETFGSVLNIICEKRTKLFLESGKEFR
jgi:radical SAM-linked protein